MHPNAQVEDCQKTEKLPIRKDEETPLASGPAAGPHLVENEPLLCVDDFDFLSKLGIDR